MFNSHANITRDDPFLMVYDERGQVPQRVYPPAWKLNFETGSPGNSRILQNERVFI